MAEKKTYPQIPSTVWWGVRSVLQKSPNATIDERLLAVQLKVQPAAARTYLNDLRSVGIITDDGKTTPLARKWRLDESYADAVSELIKAVYPEQLVDLAPPGSAERQTVVSWFLHEGLGQGAAGNKAATYMLLSSPIPNDAAKAPPRGGQSETAPRNKSARTKAASARTNTVAQTQSGLVDERASNGAGAVAVSRPETLPLNVNVQIHISADAGTEQIESIFQAMRRYLYDAPAS